MSQKNETPILVLSLLITTLLIGGGWWWFNRNGDLSLNSLVKSQQNKSDSDTPNTSTAPAISSSGTKGNTFAAVKNVPAGLFNYGGSTSWAPIRESVDKKNSGRTR